MREHYGVHSPPTVELIQRLALLGHVTTSPHAADRLLARRIYIDELLDGLTGPIRIIEDRPGDPRGHSCVVELRTKKRRILHCPCAVVRADTYGEERLVIITVYDP